MPGFGGFLAGKSGVAKRESLVTMGELMKHEHFYDTELHYAPDLELGIANVFFAGSSNKHRLAWNDAKTICLVLSGEVYTNAAVSPSHASQLIRRYESDGIAFVSNLNGSFAGLVIDLLTRQQHLFIDRFGLHRIYYHESRDGFFFCSEAKPLLALFPDLRQWDQRGLAEVCTLGCVLQNRTLFKNISLLPTGFTWTFHADGRREKRRYFDPARWEQQPRLNIHTYAERLREVFARIVPRYLAGEERVAASITGGLDSRMIMAWARAAPGNLPCFTFGGPYRECADVRIGRRVAEICKQPHTILQINSDFFQNFAGLAERTVRLSSGTMDVSGAVELYVNQRARQIAPIRLTGNYGSEILRSNVAFRPHCPDPSLFTPQFNQLIAEAVQTYRLEASTHRLSFIAFKQIPWHHHARQTIERSQLTPRSPFLDNELVALAYQAPCEFSTSPIPLLELIAEGNRALATLPSDRALRYGPSTVRNMLARTWQELTAKGEYAFDYGMPPCLVHFDRMLAPLRLERVFLGFHKFYHFRIWYRDQLSDYIRSAGTNISDQPFCYRDGAAQRITAEHTTGRANRTSDLHRLLMVQLVERTLIHS